MVAFMFARLVVECTCGTAAGIMACAFTWQMLDGLASMAELMRDESSGASREPRT